MTEHILLVFPHPDDEVFFCSGTVMEYTKRNIPVSYVCLTLGEMGRGLGGANRQTLPFLRRKEFEKSCEILGIDDYRLWGYWDKTIEFEDPEPLIHRILETIAEIKPSLIITFYPGYSVHPDHDATGDLVVQAVQRIPRENRPTVYLSAVFKTTIKGIGKPDVIHDVTPFLERKLACIQAYPSQFARFIKGIEQGDLAQVPELATERFWILK